MTKTWLKKQTKFTKTFNRRDQANFENLAQLKNNIANETNVIWQTQFTKNIDQINKANLENLLNQPRMPPKK